MNLAAETHAAASKTKVTAIGISRQNVMVARVMFPTLNSSYFDPLVSGTNKIYDIN